MGAYLKMLLPMLVAGAALAVACGGDSKTVKIPGGGEVSVSDKVPDSFPKDYPIYGGAKVTSSLSGTTSGVTGTTVSWETDDGLSKVTDFYTNAFQSGAWTAAASGKVNDAAYWTGSSKDGTKSYYLVLGTQGNKTTISATVGDTPNNASSSGSKTSTSGASATAEPSSDGSSAPATLPAEVKVAKDFPADRVPFPSGARVTSSSSFGGGGSKTYSVELYVRDTPEKVSEYFASELPKHGWTNAFTSTTNGEYYLNFTKTGAEPTSTESVTVSVTQTDVSGYARADLVVLLPGP